MTQQSPIIVTSALLYANGELHLGHLVEQIQTDIWARFQRMQGRECLYICGDDAHGTAIMLSAEKNNTSPEEWIARIQRSHEEDSKAFHIGFDHYYTTHSLENQGLANTIFAKLQASGSIVEKPLEQAFDPEKNMFLPDRFVKGTCPRCGATDQYGDNCEQCGATYNPSELIDARSVVSGATPVQKTTQHLFLHLAEHQTILKEWLKQGVPQSAVANKLKEWLDNDLQDWCITRDAPYFGFEVPGYPDKYFYVWMDAPIGYMAILKHLCAERDDLDFDALWSADSDAEIYHFIGKDIVYFHSLYWPTMLAAAGFKKPSAIFAHGFLTVDGQKMSKSRGTFITAKQYLEQLNPEYLRYYLAAKLGPGVDDIDLNWEDFSNRINSDLVGKVVNIASRCAGILHKHFGGHLSAKMHNIPLWQAATDAAETVGQAYQERHYSRAIRDIIALADQANQYIAEMQPWALVKDDATKSDAQAVCTQGINLFRLLMIYLQPVLPVTAESAAEFLRTPGFQWQDAATPLLDHEIAPFTHLLQRTEGWQAPDAATS